MPLFPEPLERDLEALLARAPEPPLALVPMLRAVERALGWLDDHALAALAARAGVSVEDAHNLAAYFDVSRSPPEARFVVEVCVNTACRRRGGEVLLEGLAARLRGETAGRFALREIVCLDRCESGPALRVDGEIHDELTVERALSLLDALAGAAG